MRVIKYIFNTLFILTILCGISKASHVSGGDITYTCVGPNQYEITLKLYRDCSGITMSTTSSVSFTNSCGLVNPSNLSLTLRNPSNTSVNCTPVASCNTEVSQLCPSQTSNSSCNGGSLPGMQEYIYKGMVTFPAPCNSWTIAYSLNARNTSVNVSNSQTLNFYVETTMNSVNDPCNNSAYFTAQPIPYVCVNNPVSYNLGVVDPDADSLYFTLIPAKSAPNTNVTYNAGYSGAAPIPGITINNTTGQINFTPTMIGNFIVVVQVEEFDINGISLGTVARDFQFVIQSCSNTPPDPSGGAITNFSGTATQTGNFTIEMCEGQYFSFDAVFNDPNSGDSLSMTTNISSVLTGSSFSSSGSNPLTSSFSWTAPAGSGGSFSFVVTINDGACPVPGINSFTYTVDVITATSAGSDKYYCPAGGPVQLQATGGSSFNWSPSTGLSCTNCSNPLASPSATTTYVVTSNLASGCINTDTVTVFVVLDFTLTVTDDTTICRNQNVLLQATGSPSSFAPFTYSWDPSTSLSSTNSSTTYANPQLTETFYVTATSNTGCTIRDSVTVTINGEAPIVFATTDKNVVCAGEQVQLSTAFMQPCGIVEYPCTGPSDVVEVGTGTLSSTFASPFYGGLLLPSKKTQLIYPASEIAATTGGGKNITALAFNITSLPATPTSGVINIKIGCTNQGEFTTYTDDFIEGLVPVKTNYLFTPVVGWNTIILDDSYRWDGTSDVAVEICTDIGFSASLSTAYTSTFPRYYTLQRTNGNSGLACLDSTGTRTTSRANIRFTMCDAVPTTSYSYSWTPTTGLSDPNIPNPTATIYNNIIYQVNVTELANPSCVGNDTVAVYIDSTNYVTAIPDTSVCPGDTVQLNAIVSGPQPSASIPCGTNNTTCAGTPYQATIGTGTTFNAQTQYPAPYGNYYWGAKHQILYTAADLLAAGMQSGTISELAFNVASLNTSTSIHENVEIKMGCTNVTSLTAWETGLSTVYNNPSYTVTTGWNTHVFNNSFDWDGISNIVVEFCFNNSSYTRNVSTYWTTTSYTSVIRKIADNATVCSSTAAPTSSSNRPNIRFTTCDAPPIVLTYNWTPAGDVSDPNIQNPTAVIPGPGSSTFVVNVTGTRCALNDTLTITIDTNTTPVISASGPTTFCQGDSVILTSSSPTGNTWSTGATTQSITVTTSGSYTVSGGCGGGSSAAVIVTVNPNDTITLTSAAGTDAQTVCINTPITDITYSVTGGGTGASATGFPTGVTGSFTGGTFTISGTPTQSGLFNYTVTTTGSCTPDSATGTITVNPTPIVITSNDTAICNGSSATISASGATSYSWDNGLGAGQSHTVSPTTTTTYVVTGTDTNSCQNTDTVVITVNALPVIDSIPFTNESACGANDGSITIYATGTGLTYSIDGGATFVGSNSFTALAAGTYNIVVQNSNGCSANGGVISISSAGAPAAPAATISPNPACEGDSLTLTVTTPVAGETYNWSGPNAFTASGQMVGIANATPAMSGIYTVTASVGSCVSSGTTINVTINPNDIITLSSAAGSNNQTICQNESIATITYSVTGGANGASASGLPAGVTGSFAGGTFTISGTPAVVGSFNYTVTTSGVCAADSAFGTITINALPTVVANASATSICSGDPVTLTGSGANSYSWDNGVTDGVAFNPATTATYTVVGTDANGCQNTDSVTVTVNNCTQPLASFTASATTICQGDSITFTDNSSSSSITNWNWTFGGGTPGSASTQGPHTVVFNSSGSFNITLQITDANGVDDSTITIVVNPLPTVVANASANSICSGDPVTLTGSGANSYSWDNGVTDGVAFNPATTATYTVVGTDANGCQNTDSVTVTVNNCTQPLASFTASATTICQGDSITFTDNSSSSSITNWNWTFGGGTPGSASTQGPHTVVFNSSGSFNITLQITDANGVDDSTITIIVNPIATATDVQVACNSYTWIDGFTYFASTNSPTFTFPNGTANGCDSVVNLNLTITTPNSTTQTFNECQGFSVTVGTNTYNSTGTYTDIVGCDTTITNLTINPAPQITLIKADDNCGSNSGNISANLVSGPAPISYSWNTGSSDSTISNLPAGVYIVTVTDANGCSTSNNIVINDLEIDCEYFAYVPNVFSPNDDGNNDVLFVYGDGIQFINMKIYNRWGNKVFEINDINEGWNGKYKGEEQNTAVFVYVLEVTFINGKSITQSGNVSLVK